MATTDLDRIAKRAGELAELDQRLLATMLIARRAGWRINNGAALSQDRRATPQQEWTKATMVTAIIRDEFHFMIPGDH